MEAAEDSLHPHTDLLKLAQFLGRLEQLDTYATARPWSVRPLEHDDWGLVRGGPGLPPVATAAMSWWFKAEDRGRAEGPSPIPENAAIIAESRVALHHLLAIARGAQAFQEAKDAFREDPVQGGRDFVQASEKLTHILQVVNKEISHGL